MVTLKYLILTIIGFFCLNSVKAQASGCLKFKQGKFKMIYNEKLLIIKRDATHQYEYYNNSNVPISYKIKWIGNCSYILKPDANNFKRFPNTPKNAFITVNIISYNKNTYKIKAISNFSPLVLESEITKIN